MSEAKPITDPLCQDPPKVLVEREVCAALNQITTVRVADDVQPPDPKRWFTRLVDGLGFPLNVTGDNEVTYLIDGPNTFQSMAESIRTTYGEPGIAGKRYYIYLLAWYLDDTFRIVPSDPKSEIDNLLAEASERGVQIRMMLWIQKPGEQEAVRKSADRINGKTDFIIGGVQKRIKGGAAIIDDHTLPLGCHHQKILIVNGKDGLHAFCGGIDINQDRLVEYHDVHCRIRGSAALDLLHIFEQRWNDHPDSKPIDKTSPLRSLEFRDVALTNNQQYVQIGRTYGNGLHANFGQTFKTGYGFALQGEQTVKALVLHAISQARRFIYMEELYLVNLDVSQALEKALDHIEHLIILINDASLLKEYDPADVHVWGQPQADYHRYDFLSPLWAKARDKVHVFTLNRDLKHRYVHAKTWIMDDEFAIIGSANCNLRSYTYDSDAVAGISDAPSRGSAKFNFAHRLRVALWAEHLDMDTPQGHAELADGVASVVHWHKEPQPKIQPYPERLMLKLPSLIDIPADTVGWSAMDPDGS